MTAEAGRALLAYDWPHNIRELEQCLARSVVLAKGGVIDVEHLPREIGALAAIAGRAPEPDVDPADSDALRGELVTHLEAHRGNVAEVARAMGKGRTQIHRWLKRYRLDPERFRR
jgi:DNA-binding NtrC family response regulator